MIMKGKELKGYCYVEPLGFENNKDFSWWINLCLRFNDRAKSSKKKLSQNRSENERGKIIETLSKSDDTNAQVVAAFMKNNEPLSH